MKGYQLTPILVGLLCLYTPFLYGQVTADFTANQTAGCGSLQASFEDGSSSSAGRIVSWAWDLGGVQSFNRNPGRIFGSPGNYRICLTATDDKGNSATTCKDNYIKVYNLPQPDFMAVDSLGCSPHTTDFIDLTSTQDGAIVEWIWGLGGSAGVVINDGSLSTISSTYTETDIR